MPLYLHLFIHFSLALLTGYLAGRYFKNWRLGIIAGVLGGFLIDLDHVLEYFFVFGLNFNIFHFFSGWQFLKSDKIYIIFHAWEWLLLLLLLAWILKRYRNVKIFLIILAWAMAVHLVSDSLINYYPWKFYAISYRASQDFSAPRLLSPEQWNKNLEMKTRVAF